MDVLWGDGTGCMPYGGIDCPTIKVLAEALLQFSTIAHSPTHLLTHNFHYSLLQTHCVSVYLLIERAEGTCGIA